MNVFKFSLDDYKVNWILLFGNLILGGTLNNKAYFMPCEIEEVLTIDSSSILLSYTDWMILNINTYFNTYDTRSEANE